MKHRVPTPEEVKLWEASNRFTRRGTDLPVEKPPEESFADALENIFPRSGKIEKGEVASCSLSNDPRTAAAPTPTLPRWGRELPPLVPLTAREAARFLKSMPAIEAVLDLHGLNKLDAYARVYGFVTGHARAGRRHIVIITGKGRAGVGLLRRELPHWLNEPALRPLLSAFTHAAPEKGGSGVTHVVLKHMSKNS